MTPIKRPATQAEKYFAAGVQQAERFESALQRAREYMIHAGINFRKAKELLGHGDWEQFVIAQGRLRVRTVQKYMEIANKALEWAKIEQAKLTGTKLEKYAKSDVRLMSTVEVNALLRDLGFFRKFGEYDKAIYDQRKLGNGQLELDFEAGKVEATMAWLAPLADPRSKLILPDGKAPSETWQKLKSLAQRLVQRADEELGEIRDI